MIAEPSNRDEEGALVGEIALAAIHDGDTAIRGKALGHMRIERIGKIEAAQHGITEATWRPFPAPVPSPRK